MRVVWASEGVHHGLLTSSSASLWFSKRGFRLLDLLAAAEPCHIPEEVSAGRPRDRVVRIRPSHGKTFTFYRTT